MLHTSVVPTVGVIAQRLGVPIHRVAYIIRARGIAPVGRAGNARTFAEEQVEQISVELHQIEEARRTSRG